jgi:hypothetical protein
MAFDPLRGGGCLLLVLAGWAAGRWVWPAGDQGVEFREPGKVAGPGAGEVRSPAGPGHRVPPAKTAGVKPVDGKAAGRERRASGSDAGFRDRARQMALEPPPALTDFLAAVTDSEVLRATLLEDAVIWAFCRKPEQGLLLLSSLAGREEIGTLTVKALRFFPPKELPVVLAWYHRLPEAGLKATARQELVKVLVHRDFRQAVALVAGMPHGTSDELENRRDELSGVFGKLNPSQQVELMSQPGPGLLPEDEPFLVELARLDEINELRQYDREALVEKFAAAEAFLSPGSVLTFFSGWAKSDPIRAARGLAQLPAEEKTPVLYMEFAAKWAMGNVGMASQWVKDLPEGETKTGAVRGLVAGLREDYPVEAAIWAGSLTDSAVKLSELKQVLAATSGPALTGLKAAVNALNLTPGERVELNLTTTP